MAFSRAKRLVNQERWSRGIEPMRRVGRLIDIENRTSSCQTDSRGKILSQTPTNEQPEAMAFRQVQEWLASESDRRHEMSWPATTVRGPSV